MVVVLVVLEGRDKWVVLVKVLSLAVVKVLPDVVCRVRFPHFGLVAAHVFIARV